MMKKITLALLLCVVIAAAGCSSAGSVLKKTTAEAAQTVSDKKTQESDGADKEAAEQAEQKAVSKADAGKETAAASVAKADDGKESAEGKKSSKNKKKKSDSATKTSDTADQKTEDKSSGGEKTEAEKKAEENRKAAAKKAKEAEEKKKKFDEEVAGDYVPEGFLPYGTYNLVFDNGYLVKSRYSSLGLTYYYESEEFLFKLNKDLPDMTTNVAHLLFNTSSPMTDPGDEVFPYSEPYVLQISLDNGSYYEVYRDNLDLHGRIFVRDVWEIFRQKFEGTF
jgi:chemotaxis protein histidine kinase CheA